MYIYTYIFWGKSKHIHVHVQTHTISYVHTCTSPELHTYKYGDISSETVVILPYFVHMHVSFQAKEVNAPKGKSKCFSRHSRGNISGA